MAIQINALPTWVPSSATRLGITNMNGLITQSIPFAVLGLCFCMCATFLCRLTDHTLQMLKSMTCDVGVMESVDVRHAVLMEALAACEDQSVSLVRCL